MKQTKPLAYFLLFLFLFVLALALRSWVEPGPEISPGGIETLFSSPSPDLTPASPPSDPVTTPAEPSSQPGSPPNESGVSPLKIAYFADFSQEFSLRLRQLLEENAEAENWEIVSYNTKNKEIIYENQVKNAVSKDKGQVAILEGGGENVLAYAQTLRDAGYRVISLNSGLENTENVDILVQIDQNWAKTAELVNELLTEKMSPDQSYLLFPDEANPALENAFYDNLNFGRFFTVYAGKSQETSRIYSLYCMETRPNLGCILTGSAQAALGAAQAAESAQSLGTQGFERDRLTLGALSLDDTLLDLLEEGRIDFALGVTAEQAFDEIQNILPDILTKKQKKQVEIEPILVTSKTVNEYRGQE